MGLLFPTLLISTGEGTKVGELTLSRATSVVLFIMYIAYLYFQVRNILSIIFKYLYLFYYLIFLASFSSSSL